MKKISKETREQIRTQFTTTVSYEENGVSVYEAINLEVLENCEKLPNVSVFFDPISSAASVKGI